MLDLDAIKKRWTCWHDVEESSAIEVMLGEDIPALIAEIEKLRKVLEFYAAPRQYCKWGKPTSPIEDDSGAKATVALEE